MNSGNSPHNTHHGAALIRRLLSSGFVPDHLMSKSFGSVQGLVQRLCWLAKRDLSDQHPEFYFPEMERQDRIVRTLIAAEFNEFLLSKVHFCPDVYVKCSLAIFAFGCEDHDRGKRTAYAVRCMFNAGMISGLIGHKRIRRIDRFDPEKPSDRKPRRYRVDSIQFSRMLLEEICDALISWREKQK